MDDADQVHERLASWWTDAGRVGIAGPGSVDDHLARAGRFRDAVEAPASFVDLGTGAGMPGLALALWWPAARGLLIDGSERRIAFVDRWIQRLGLGDRIEAVAMRAEELARRAEHRHAHDLVVARSFGVPAATAECATGFLRSGGVLAVSEPPAAGHDAGTTARWPAEELSVLGLVPLGVRSGIAVLEQRTTCDERWPRRTGVPTKRPLW